MIENFAGHKIWKFKIKIVIFCGRSPARGAWIEIGKNAFLF